jgi:ribosomal protein S18 acetylase RimI-like enzyme
MVRPFRPDDAAQVTSLWERVFPDDRPWSAPAAVIDRKLAQKDGLLWVAEVDGGVAGAVMAGYDGHRGWIYHLAVEPALRRRGIGRALVAAAEAALVALGCPKINLQVSAANRDVVAFYERLAYRVEERVSMGKTTGAARR